MGLDWNPIGKPKPGFESEFASIFQQIGESSNSYARANNLQHIEFLADGDFEEKSPESKAHILYSAARWCEYWSSRGHGLEADW
jgi:hypothetical protein